MILQGDELEFAISQYLDGTLAADALAVLEERLATDGEVRELLREYRQINTTLRGCPSCPAVDWSDFSSRILTNIASKDVADATADRTFPLRLRPVGVSFATFVGHRFFRPLALAASLLVGVSAAVFIFAHHAKPVPTIAKVEGPKVEQSSGPVVAEVSIGPAPSVATTNWRSRDEAIDRPSIVLIDRADNPAPDNDSVY